MDAKHDDGDDKRAASPQEPTTLTRGLPIKRNDVRAWIPNALGAIAYLSCATRGIRSRLRTRVPLAHHPPAATIHSHWSTAPGSG